jgi:phosphoribosylformimino-5-aminoimidazole carboxamide ribotide isomerase
MKSLMKILPVIDVMHGQVVRGVAGQRDKYRPIVSRLTTSTAPRDVAAAFREHFGFDALYLADLDAIAGRQPALDLYHALCEDGFRLWVDAGLREARDAAALLDAGGDSIIAGLESLAGPAALAALVKRCGRERIVFSLDLKMGRPLGDVSAWGTPDPLDIVDQAVVLGVRRFIVLDLSNVGVGQGVGTVALCREVRSRHAGLEMTTGGGIRGIDDLHRLEASGVDYALAASALHDGALAPSDIRHIGR